MSTEHQPVTTKDVEPSIGWSDADPAALPATRQQMVHRLEDERGASKTQQIERVIVRHSDEIDQLITALAIAQGGFDELDRTLTAQVESRRTGGKYEYEYETLADVIRATRKPLSENGLAVMQFPFPGRESITIRTMLAHKSGQWICNDLTASLVSLDPQAIGSGITYLQRYARKAILGLAAGYEDDDGAAATKAAPARPAAPAGFDEWLIDLRAVADEGTPRLQETWKSSKAEWRTHLTTTAAKEWEAIKRRAVEINQKKVSA